MIDEQIRRISEIRRITMESHYNYMRLLLQSNHFLENASTPPATDDTTE